MLRAKSERTPASKAASEKVATCRNKPQQRERGFSDEIHAHAKSLSAARPQQLSSGSSAWSCITHHAAQKEICLHQRISFGASAGGTDWYLQRQVDKYDSHSESSKCGAAQWAPFAWRISSARSFELLCDKRSARSSSKSEPPEHTGQESHTHLHVPCEPCLLSHLSTASQLRPTASSVERPELTPVLLCCSLAAYDTSGPTDAHHSRAQTKDPATCFLQLRPDQSPWPCLSRLRPFSHSCLQARFALL